MMTMTVFECSTCVGYDVIICYVHHNIRMMIEKYSSFDNSFLFSSFCHDGMGAGWDGAVHVFHRLEDWVGGERWKNIYTLCDLASVTQSAPNKSSRSALNVTVMLAARHLASRTASAFRGARLAVLAPQTDTLRCFSSTPKKKSKSSMSPTITIELEDGEDEEADDEAEPVTDFMKPRLIVAELDKNIIGQNDAKKAVAVALRNRWRRMQLDEDMRREITPKNILMIGPTGCGKTEIARRLAMLADAPFIKVEATKFTEVGFHGRDVDMIVRDLLDNGIMLARKRLTNEYQKLVEIKVRDQIIRKILGKEKRKDVLESRSKKDAKSVNDDQTHESMVNLYKNGEFDHLTIKVDVPAGNRNVVLPIGNSPDNANAINDLMNQMKGGMGMGKPEKKEMTVEDAKPFLFDQELQKMLDEADVIKEAIEDVQQNGIVFIDEIDKICNSSDYRGADASAEGVQKDLLPIIEGSVVSTKHGNVATDHILFVASGAFHACKPSDLLPELQGRLPIRVELKGLDEEDLYRILTEPVSNILLQNKLLIETEGVNLVYEDEAVREIARLAAEVNKSVENIGARRLHTCVERIIEEISFDAADMEAGETITIDKETVKERLGDLIKEVDLSKFIL